VTAGLGESSPRKFISVRHSSLFRFQALICYSDVLDGAMIVLAIYTLNFAHPGVLLARKPLLKSSSNA